LPALAPAGLGGSLAAQLVSSHWYRVAGMAPRLRDHLRVHVHHYRGEVWRVVEDRLNGRFHRFDRAAWRIICLLDGQLTLDQIWLRLAAEAAEHTPSQDDLLGLLGQLHGLDLLAAGSLPDLAEQGERDRRQARQKQRQRWMNPLAIRIPLWDPDRFLARWVQRLAPVLNRRGALLWLVWVLPAVVLAISHAQELSSNFAERLLAMDNLLLLGLLFPLIKAAHELGHGLACKLRGGEVHDMGLMLLIFLPVPYVEASSAWAFPDKRDRMLVGAAGMLVEVALAALAFYLWLWLEPGLAKAMAYNVAVLAGVTTVVFNGNPLLRYDGYYIASDALEIPNLAQRGGRYWAWLFARRVVGRRAAQRPGTAPGETLWFVLYTPLSFVYRMFVLFTIAIFVATQYFVVGVAIALWSMVMSLGLPIYKGLAWLRRQVWGAHAPARGRRTVMGLGLAIALLVGVLPMPLSTQVDGVLWLPDSGVLRVAQAGFVKSLAVANGSAVNTGQTVMQLREPALAAKVAVQVARTESARARWDALRQTEPAKAERARTELAREEGELADLQGRDQRLALRTGAQGRLWLQDAADLEGRFVKQGQIVGYVIPPSSPVVRVIVDQTDADLIRAGTRQITVKLPFAPQQSWPAKVVRAVPAASTDLPSAALGRHGGGGVATDPRDESGRKALVSHFELELALPPEFAHHFIGSRVSVRFGHDAEPLVQRWWRGLRHLFLGQFQS
jgi:putative peptide zinc metalloprotease protein